MPTFRQLPKKLDKDFQAEVWGLEGFKAGGLIFSDLILESRVEGGIASLAAAPKGPETRPPERSGNKPNRHENCQFS